MDEVPEFVDEKIVVDNNSTDSSISQAKIKKASVFEENQQGYGHAIRRGYKESTGDIMVVIDGDGTYPIKDLQTLLDYFLDKKLDFLSASRFPLYNQEVMKLYSKVGNWVLTKVTWILFGFNLKDSQSGMWLINRAAYNKIRLDSGGMGLSEEIKIRALKDKTIKFGETHINYESRIGKVKLKPVSDGIKNLLFLFKLRFFG